MDTTMLKNTLTADSDFNTAFTENGAKALRTSGKALLDLNFATASLRRASEDDIIAKFLDAYAENPVLAVKWLFFASDVREGMGERRLFKVIFKRLASTNPDVARYMIPFVPEYSRWDNLFVLFDTPLESEMLDFVAKTFNDDLFKESNNEPISLLAKWLPSINTTSNETKALAKRFIKAFRFDQKTYRQSLSKLRKHLDVVETKMSANAWSDIDYTSVPSKANLIYRNAFLRHDSERRAEFLTKVSEGKETINGDVNFPYEVLNKYVDASVFYEKAAKEVDSTIEALWKALPDYVNGNASTLVVADGSGSMTCEAANGVSALTVANSLAIYFAERLTGPFKDTYITFSANPQLVYVTGTLLDKLTTALHHNEVSNTDIEKTFDLILKTAIQNHLSQNELPKNVLIISDMEFDMAHGNGWNNPENDATLFETIANKYNTEGYQLPRLVFWNVNSRTGAIPMRENPNGVALVSGFSPIIAKMVLSEELDPYKCLLDQLNAPRYNPVEEAFANAM